MYVPPKVKPLCPPEERPRFEDVPYARVTLDNGQAYTLKLDIYQSPEQNTPGPCIIYIFGGGFLWGEYKQVTQKAVYCRDLVRLTKEGYTVVCPDYRLVSQSIFPACIHDVKGVVRFHTAFFDFVLDTHSFLSSLKIIFLLLFLSGMDVSSFFVNLRNSMSQSY